MKDLKYQHFLLHLLSYPLNLLFSKLSIFHSQFHSHFLPIRTCVMRNKSTMISLPIKTYLGFRMVQ